jgi:hypothetical protein
MKRTRLLFLVTALALTGCATSLAPTDNFNDWTNSTAYHHYQQSPRNAVPAYAVDADDGVSGE